MKRYALIAGIIAASSLALFAIAQRMNLPIMRDPHAWLEGHGAASGALGVGLLIADVFLPVPSSGVMIAHGALFGAFVGTILSLLGSLGAAAVGFAVGRSGGPLLTRLISPKEHARADHLLERWGALAIVATRPLPVLAETVTILAGASPLGWTRALLAALAGSLPAALLYALAGAAFAGMGSATLVFLGVGMMGGVFWLLGRKRTKRATLSQGIFRAFRIRTSSACEEE